MNVRATLGTQDLRRRGTGILACVPIFSHLLSREGFIKGSARWGTGPTHWPARTRNPARGQRGALGNHRVRRFIS
jgi:hypothetical protein